MTLPYERTRAVVQTRGFLNELRVDTSVPEPIRQEARRLLRHYPTVLEMNLACKQILVDRVLILEAVFSAGHYD